MCQQTCLLAIVFQRLINSALQTDQVFLNALKLFKLHFRLFERLREIINRCSVFSAYPFEKIHPFRCLLKGSLICFKAVDGIAQFHAHILGFVVHSLDSGSQGFKRLIIARNF